MVVSCNLETEWEEVVVDYFEAVLLRGPVVVAAHSKARNGFYRSNTSIMGSNPTRSMDMCARFPLLISILCRQTPCDGLILPPGSLPKCL
jgi:hypothetical protein